MAPDAQHILETNKAYFDSVAEVYGTKPHAIELARRLASLFLKAYPFDEDSTAILDFACGTGLISQHLTPHAKSIVGVDISPGMVRRYNQRVEQQGLEPEDMRAVCVGVEADLKDEGNSEGDLTDFEDQFDVVVCAASYHHFPSIEDTTRQLASVLKAGGTLMVADLLKAEGAEDLYPEHGNNSSLVCHHGGIAEADIRSAFEAAGLTEMRISVHDIAAKRKGQSVKFFLMLGKRA